MKYIKVTTYFVLAACLCVVGVRVFANTTISPDSYNHYAWNDTIGWIDFYNTPGTISMSSDGITGYANSDVGYIAFDCASSPTPPADCAASFPDWKTTRSGSAISGWAWNDQIGWISLSCGNTGSCATSNYQVSVSGGEFHGWAWNDTVGWISFNCENTGTCTTVNYKVAYLAEAAANADLVSSTFDTGAAAGVVYNTIVYQGSKPVGTEVQFQLAVSSSSDGPWNFSGYDGTDTTYYTPTGPNIPIALNSTLYKNKRYFRYKVFLNTDVSQQVTPEITQIVVTWSR